VLSTRSRVYRERKVDIDAMDDDQLLAAMIAEPTLLRRPLVEDNGQLVIGMDRKRLVALRSKI
jgi:arsenate reductase-like glutaredoxin family protein